MKRKSKRRWMVFFCRVEELLRYSLEGTFPGEREQTIELLAYENGIPASEIYFAIVTA